MTSADSFVPPPGGAPVVVAARQNAGRPVRLLLELARNTPPGDGARIHLGDQDLSRADPGTARRVVEELGRDRAWVIAAAAPMERQLFRLWQDDVLGGGTSTYDEWLEGRLRASPAGLPLLEETLDVWVEAVGSDQLLVVVDDPATEQSTGRRLEELIGLPTGSLDPGPEPDRHPDRQADPVRDLTWSEIELVRAANTALAGPGWDSGIDRLTLRAAVVEGLRSQAGVPTGPGWATLPARAAEQVRQLAGRDLAAVDRHGVPVLGASRRLGEVTSTETSSAGVPELRVESAAAAIQRAIEAGLNLVAGQAARDRRTP